MKRLVSVLACLVCVGLLTACPTAPPLPPADPGPRTRNVSVVGNDWHTAIIIARSEVVATGLLPEAADFPDAPFLEFGWGDRVYYPAERKTVGMALAAALTPSPAVMHVAGLAGIPAPNEADREVVTVALTENGFRRLVSAIAGEFQRPDGYAAQPVSRGLYPNSNFYDAHGRFHLYNTCNTWTARMLRAGGVDISPAGIVTADNVMTRLSGAPPPA